MDNILCRGSVKIDTSSTQNIMSLSQQETNFLTTFVASGKRIFTLEQAAPWATRMEDGDWS